MPSVDAAGSEAGEGAARADAPGARLDAARERLRSEIPPRDDD